MDGRCSEEGDCGRGLWRRRRGRAVGRAVDAAGRTRTVNAYITLLRCSRDKDLSLDLDIIQVTTIIQE
jgi:hypothetical protein